MCTRHSEASAVAIQPHLLQFHVSVRSFALHAPAGLVLPFQDSLLCDAVCIQDVMQPQCLGASF